MTKPQDLRELTDDALLHKLAEAKQGLYWLAGRCADIFISNHTAADSISGVRTSCRNMYGMDELTADAMLCGVGQKTAELAQLFEVRLNATDDYEKILTSANQRLLELSLAERDKGQVQNKRRSSRMRRDGKIVVTPCARGVLGTPVQVRLRDLSATGIGLTHSGKFEPGSQFVISLPDRDGGSKTLLYTVRRCDKSGTLNSVGAELTSVLRPKMPLPRPHRASGA